MLSWLPGHGESDSDNLGQPEHEICDDCDSRTEFGGFGFVLPDDFEDDDWPKQEEEFGNHKIEFAVFEDSGECRVAFLSADAKPEKCGDQVDDSDSEQNRGTEFELKRLS